MYRLLSALSLLAAISLFVGCGQGTGDSRDAAQRDAAHKDNVMTVPVKDQVAGKDTVAQKDALSKDGATKVGTPTVAKDMPWIKPADRQKLFMDFNMTDQDGKPFNLKQTLGKPTISTFIFTRCPNPQMCPLQAKKMAWLQEKLDKAGLGDKINLLLISFDPDYDTPQRLKKFGEDNGVKFTNAKMLRPAVPEFREFIDEFPIRVGYSQVGEVNHKTDLFMLDHKGGFARMYFGMWNDDKVLEETRKLVDEAILDGATPPDDSKQK